MFVVEMGMEEGARNDLGTAGDKFSDARCACLPALGPINDARLPRGHLIIYMSLNQQGILSQSMRMDSRAGCEAMRSAKQSLQSLATYADTVVMS